MQLFQEKYNRKSLRTCVKYFLDMTQKVVFRKEKSDKYDLIKIQNYCTFKNTIKEMKRADWEKIFAKDKSMKYL